MTTGLIITAAVSACIAVMVYLAWKAPLGWEDSEGWHEGIEPDEHADRDNLGI